MDKKKTSDTSPLETSFSGRKSEPQTDNWARTLFQKAHGTNTSQRPRRTAPQGDSTQRLIRRKRGLHRGNKHHTLQSTPDKSPHQGTGNLPPKHRHPTTCPTASAEVLCDTSGSPPTPRFAQEPPGLSIQPHLLQAFQFVIPPLKRTTTAYRWTRKASYRQTVQRRSLRPRHPPQK